MAQLACFISVQQGGSMLTPQTSSRNTSDPKKHQLTPRPGLPYTVAGQHCISPVTAWVMTDIGVGGLWAEKAASSR